MFAPRELVISEITYREPGFCVIGLERGPQGVSSVRPLPPKRSAWPNFPFKRGDILNFRLFREGIGGSHAEDRRSTGVLGKAGDISERELVTLLRQAELAQQTRDLFGCEVRESPMGGDAVWVSPSEARRSIAGCDFRDIRFRFGYGRLRVVLSLAWGDVLLDLPVVDRDWNDFFGGAVAQAGGLARQTRVLDYFNARIRQEIRSSDHRFARIGIARPQRECCWLMLDSLFPMPKKEWIQGLANR